jgi:molybdopterin converting factor subunit 1
MTTRVLLFAALADTIGESAVTIDVDEHATVGDALDALAERFPDIAAVRNRLATAVNMAYVRTDHPLKPGDELALIPPVSGG